MKSKKEIKEKSKIKIYCKNPSCFTHYLVNNKMKSKKEIREEHNITFKEEVLENKMFDDYDKNIIMAHLSNFYCVFQLGWDRANKNHEKRVLEILRRNLVGGIADMDAVLKVIEKEIKN